MDTKKGDSDAAVEELAVDTQVRDIDGCDEKVGCEEEASY